ncbi:TPA: hypothetical protein N0F65_003729 [Lagenidium giganteum]|uniref:Uncharacterized protein n=1 Tax=Lagenidium giganteum TaxID=4803 RepID=A0AAV2Z3W3_9STRA|nr:TPA: hypothetical protein N0F65_003729 [Lagenidium giganteum]
MHSALWTRRPATPSTGCVSSSSESCHCTRRRTS